MEFAQPSSGLGKADYSDDLGGQSGERLKLGRQMCAARTVSVSEGRTNGSAVLGTCDATP